MQIGSKHLVGPADWYSPRHAAHHLPPRFIVQNSAPHFYIDNHSQERGRSQDEQRDKECGMGECSHDSDVMPVMVAYRSVWVGQTVHCGGLCCSFNYLSLCLSLSLSLSPSLCPPPRPDLFSSFSFSFDQSRIAASSAIYSFG